MVDRQTESYCRLLQFLRNVLQLNIDYDNVQIITDFEQGLRNAISRVLPEANNSGCWFHYIQVGTVTEVVHHGNSFSIQLGFRLIQDLGTFITSN